MIFPIDDRLAERPAPTPLYAATASVSTANVWTSVNGFAAARVFESVDAEYHAAKEGAVIADFGPLSRYALRGRNAAAFLSRVATAPALSLSAGESARGLLLDDDGGVIDLAEVSRLADDLYLMTTPSPQPRVLQLAARGLDLQIEDISRTVAAIGVLGVNAQSALSASGLKIPGDHVAASAVLRGVETAARPIQFGALPGAELIFPAEDALTVWERLMRRSSITPIGLDAMEILRIESGAPRPGADFVTRTPRPGARRPLPAEIGLPHLAPLDGGWFNGRRALRFAEPAKGEYLVTIAVDADHILPGASVNAGAKASGRITSAAWSPTARRVIAFAALPAATHGKVNDIYVVDDAGEARPARLLETAESRLAAAFEAAQV